MTVSNVPGRACSTRLAMSGVISQTGRSAKRPSGAAFSMNSRSRNALGPRSRVIGSHSRVGWTRLTSMPWIRSSLLQSLICASASASDVTFASTAPLSRSTSGLAASIALFQASRASRPMVARMQESRSTGTDQREFSFLRAKSAEDSAFLVAETNGAEPKFLVWHKHR